MIGHTAGVGSCGRRSAGILGNLICTRNLPNETSKRTYQSKVIRINDYSNGTALFPSKFIKRCRSFFNSPISDRLAGRLTAQGNRTKD